MRAVFCEHGQTLDWAKLRTFGIEEVLVPAVDSPYASADGLNIIKTQGFAPSLFVAWNWYGPMTGTQFARKCNEVMLGLGPASPNPALWADIENGAYLSQQTYADFVAAFMVEWRNLRKSRRTVWTLDPMQGGAFNGKAAAVDSIRRANVEIVVQNYGGDMEPFAADTVLRDLLLYGFPASGIRGFYDGRGASALRVWDGALWTSARLS